MLGSLLTDFYIPEGVKVMGDGGDGSFDNAVGVTDFHNPLFSKRKSLKFLIIWVRGGR